ncbi:MAG: nucleotidyltransferase domain-containing protein [Bacteroidetes bacterium]|nr:nucleotidyltransferase domain-containing protein [Bacteroidota bacterium]
MAVRTIEQVKSIINDYTALLIEAGLPIKKIILFGSYANAKQTENSDLDVAVILRKFSEDRFLTRLKLMKYCRNFDEMIEPHPFLESEFNKANPFASEILKNGVTVYS